MGKDKQVDKGSGLDKEDTNKERDKGRSNKTKITITKPGDESSTKEKTQTVEEINAILHSVPSALANAYCGPRDPLEQINDPYWKEGEPFYWELLEVFIFIFLDQ